MYNPQRHRLSRSLRSTALAVTAVVVALALPSGACADDVKVKVTARVSDSFSLTVRTDGEVSFGNVKPGKHYSTNQLPILRVMSSRPWIMTDSSDAVIQNLGGRDYPRERILRHTPQPKFNRIMKPGAYEITSRYWLDLTDRNLLSLPEGTIISTNMGYTIIQQ